MNEKYIYQEEEIIGVENETTIINKDFRFNGISLKVLITSQPIDSYKEKYHNVYIISDMFKIEPLNNLDVQEPSEIIEKMSEKDILRFMEERAIAFYLWFKYNRDYAIDSEEIPQ